MKRCKTCNNILRKTYYYRVPKTYCSKECHDKGQKTGITFVTKICGSCKSTFNWRKNVGEGKFCSPTCQYKFMEGKKSYEMTEEVRKKISLALSDEKHPGWKGDSIGYKGIHAWLKRKVGSADHCSFDPEHKSKIYDWCNVSGSYLRDLGDWIQLCRLCHRQYDLIKGGQVKYTSVKKGKYYRYVL